MHGSLEKLFRSSSYPSADLVMRRVFLKLRSGPHSGRHGACRLAILLVAGIGNAHAMAEASLGGGCAVIICDDHVDRARRLSARAMAEKRGDRSRA